MSASDARRSHEREIAALREFVTAHTLVQRGITDFDLQNEAIERLEKASKNEYVEKVIRRALT